MHPDKNDLLVTCDPTIKALFPQRRLSLSLRDEPTMGEMAEVTRGSTPNEKAVASDPLPAELLKVDHLDFTHLIYLYKTILEIASQRQVRFGGEERCIFDPKQCC